MPTENAIIKFPFETIVDEEIVKGYYVITIFNVTNPGEPVGELTWYQEGEDPETVELVMDITPG